MSSKAEEEQGDKSAPKAAKKPGVLESVFTPLMGKGYNSTEVRFVLLAAIICAFNNGFINGVTMSGWLLVGYEEPPTDVELNPPTAMVSGVAGLITSSAKHLIENAWVQYGYSVCMLLCYMGGACFTAILSPRAKPYSIDPFYGPSFFLGGTLLLASSLMAYHEVQSSRFIFYFAIAANGIQNGVASIYSANLIRCTLTGSCTDIGLVIGQCLRGNFAKIGRGAVLATIVICFWIGGLIGYLMVRQFEAYSLIVTAVMFYLVFVLNTCYLMKKLNLSFFSALAGSWDWTDVLKKIDPSGSKEEMMGLFGRLDRDGDGTLTLDELQKGLEGTVTEEELHTLLVAADKDDSGDIDEEEWTELVKALFDKDEVAA